MYGGVGEEEPQSPPILIDRGYGTARPPQRLQKHGFKLRLQAAIACDSCTARFTRAKELRLKIGDL
jgi:hypothetical protein